MEIMKVIPGKINVGYWSYYEKECFNNAKLLNPNILVENTSRKYCDLYAKGKERNINFLSLDLIDDWKNIDLFLFSDFPLTRNRLVKKAFLSGKPLFLITEENEVVYAKNWDPHNHRFFDKIFTWNDSLVDNKKYFKINVHFLDSLNIEIDSSKKKKLCVLIAGNKNALHRLELYSKRREIIRWFEHNHAQDFDLYGYGWDVWSVPVNIKWLGFLNSRKLKFIRKMFGPKYPSWKGPVENKKSVFKQYKFAIAYENARDIPGCIFEKIFDIFCAGTVPVYWGANNVTDHIPAECFIDKRRFKTYEMLYGYLKTMPEDIYLNYLNNINNFLKSKEAFQFTGTYFAQKVTDEILKTAKKVFQ
jgi:hypothetical protein